MNLMPNDIHVGDLVLAKADYPSFGIKKGNAYPIIRIWNEGSEGASYYLGELSRDGCLTIASLRSENEFVLLLNDTEEDVSPAPIDDIL